MRARIEQPRIRVLLHKTVRRTSLAQGVPISGRFSSMARLIDLTPYLGDGGASVRTQKGTREPGGGFQLVFSDKPNAGEPGASPPGMGAGSFESLYGLIEPMDVVEIRMGRGEETDARLPLIMRGFVSEVSRSESMDPGGQPSRQVSVSGQDYGKLWQQLEISYLPGYIVGQDTITAFRLFERFGVGFETSQSGGKFLQEVIDKILTPYLSRMLPGDSRLPRTIKVDTAQLIKHGTTSVSGSQNQEGSIHSILSTFLDVGAWNELFLEDREDGVWCVCRPNPFKTLAGKPIVADGYIPPTVEILDDDIVSMQLARSDTQVANYFWVRGQRFEFINDPVQRQAAASSATADSVNLTQYQNTSAVLYGIKPMIVGSEMGADAETSFTSGLPEAETRARAARIGNWQNYRREQLVAQNRDNVVLEQGFLRIKGNAAVRAGIYLRVVRGDFTAEYYVHRVQQDYTPYQGWFSNVYVDRGNGFAQRARRGGGSDSPYLAELRK